MDPIIQTIFGELLNLNGKNYKNKIMYFKFNKENLTYERVKLVPRMSAFFILGLCVSLITGFIWTDKKQETQNQIITPEERIIILKEHNSFTENKLIREIKGLNFRFPHIVLAQSKLETGNFKSGIFKENQNLFGMKEASVRINTAKGTNRGHAYYDSWKESLYDYAFYCSTYLSKIKKEELYFQYLSDSYAEDPNYVKRLKSIIEKENLKGIFK